MATFKYEWSAHLRYFNHKSDKPKEFSATNLSSRDEAVKFIADNLVGADISVTHANVHEQVSLFNNGKRLGRITFQ